MRDRFYQFSWRPRPPSLLSEADLKEIARSLRKYSEKYAKEDDVLMAQVRLLLQDVYPAIFGPAHCPQGMQNIRGQPRTPTDSAMLWAKDVMQ